MEALTIDVSDIGQLTDDALYRLSRANQCVRFERTRHGELIVMSPTGGETGVRNSLINAALVHWNEQSGRPGAVFDSSSGFRLPDGAMRAAGAAWVARDRWEGLSAKERRGFPPLCPDFVIELISESDDLRAAQAKMAEWIANGCRLAWLIDPVREQVFVYREDGSSAILPSFDAPAKGEALLPGLIGPLAPLR